MQLFESWDTPEAQYNINQLRETYLGSYIVKGTQGPSPSSILGMVYPGGHFTWSVDAYDQQGVKISSSKGIYAAANKSKPIFSLTQEGQLQGDVHVIQQNFDQAIAAYESEMEHPNALRALAMIYRTGTELNDQGDPQKALAYLKKIKDPTERDQQLIEMLEAQLDGLGRTQ